MRTMKIGQYVALAGSYGRPKLGDTDFGISRAKVIDVDPRCRTVTRGYREDESDGAVLSERISSHLLTSGYRDYVLDPAGEPLKGYVLLEYQPHVWTKEDIKTVTRCVKKAKVIGDWDEHVKLKTEQEAVDKARGQLDELRRRWDIRATKALKDKLGAAIIKEGSYVDHVDGSITLDLQLLAAALGLSVGERP